MAHRFTLKELKEFSDKQLFQMLLNERLGSVTNEYAPLADRLRQTLSRLYRDNPTGFGSRHSITINLENVSREEQKELKDYLNQNCWSWKESSHDHK